MQPDRKSRIEALLNSPNEGERAAAQAALDRIGADVVPLAVGSKEWEAARIEWHRKIQFCESRLGSPLLSPADQNLVRIWVRYIGNPWDRGAEELLAVYRMLKAAEDARDAEPVRRAWNGGQ